MITTDAPVKLTRNEGLKEGNPLLAGTIAQTLADSAAERFSDDVERNVMAPPTPATTPLVEQMLEESRKLSDALEPKTSAYHSIWLDGQEVDLNREANANFVEPLYGKRYLPRKFKTAFAIPPLNDVDIFTNDLGFIVVAEN